MQGQRRGDLLCPLLLYMHMFRRTRINALRSIRYGLNG